ncbi:MAG: iron ABC transporter permease [Bacillota bacterium]|nr:iron ABC transporter permease [Bacillota bacterium]
MNKKKWLWTVWIALPILTGMAVWIFGRYQISPSRVINVVYQWITQDPNINKADYLVVISIRLSRIILALIIGMGLSVSGVAYQSLFSNPLTTPDILGVASGAAFGAALGILNDMSPWMIQLVAVLFGVLAVGISVLLSFMKGKQSPIMLVLSGIVVTSVFSALLSSVKFVADPQSKLPEITFWLMGSMSGASFKNIMFYAPAIVICSGIIYALRWKLNILALNEDEAISLGIDLKWLKGIIIVCGTVITASSVALCGMIGWVGLLIPHISRMLLGVNTKMLVPASMSLGAVFMVLVDTLARTISSSEIPIGILSSLFGAPIFILILRRTKGALQ